MEQISMFIKSLPASFQTMELLYARIDKSKALLFCICITLSVMTIEIIYSKIANSLMLFSDGLHMLTHALSLMVTFIAIFLAKKQSNSRNQTGLSQIETIAALINGVGLVIFTVYIFYESLLRFQDLSSLNVYQTLVIAIIGLFVNLLTATILFRAGIEDLNTKSAYLHLLADTFSSIAIIAGCVVIYYTNWLIIDPLLSLVVAFVIGKWSYGLLKEAFKSLLLRRG